MLKYHRSVRVAVTLAAVASMLVPADAQAFFGCFQKKQNATAALYGGTVCNPCGQQLVCNYVPQTCYRTQTVAMPVTTLRPTCGTDPCTGCPTTVMRPVVSYQQQVQYVPYQSYRLQYSVAQPACPTATTSYYAPSLSSGVAAPTTTYAAPAIAAPASGCSSCNSGVAATSYYAPMAGTPMTTNYAPVPTTRMLTPGVVVPGAAAVVAPNTTNAYNYPTTHGNVNVNGYNYATPSASGIAPPSMYGGTSSFTPAPSVPAAGTGPGYSTSNYGSTTYGAPSMAIPSYSGSPSYASPSYSAPSYSSGSSPVTTVPTLGSSTYGSSTYGSSTLNGTTLSSAAPTPSATTGSANYAPSAGMVPVPQPTLSIPAPPTSTLSVPSLAPPATSFPTAPAAPARSPYSSGVAPSATPAATGPVMQPIPDPLNPAINRELRMGPTSTPALIDPEDKTASAWPVRRAWEYRPVGNVVQATFTRTVDESAASQTPTLPTTFAASPASALPSNVTSNNAVVSNAPSAANATRLGAPRPAMEIEAMYAPQQQYVPQQPSQPAVDRDGWRSAAR